MKPINPKFSTVHDPATGNILGDGAVVGGEHPVHKKPMPSPPKTIYSFDPEFVGKWVCEKAGGTWNPTCTAIGVERDGTLIAGIMYDAYTGSSVCMHSRCDDPAHVPRKFFWIIFDYPFNQLKVKRVTGIVSTANDKAIRVNTHLGWKYETTIADYFPDGDGIVLIMRRDDCRWLALESKYALRPLLAAA